MEKSNLSYMKFTAISGIIAYPVFTYKAIKRLMKNEKIKDSVEFIIKKAKEIAKLPPKEELTPVKIQLLRDSYNERNDFFSFHFKSEAIQKLSFDEKIEYCLEKYKEESKTIFTATNLLVLEENFLKGANATLALYFFFKYNGIDIENQRQDERTILMQINQTVVKNEYRPIKNEYQFIKNEYRSIKNEVTNNYTKNINKSEVKHTHHIHLSKDSNNAKPELPKEKLENKDLFRAIFVDKSDSDKFLSLLERRFTTSSGKLDIGKILTSGYLNELRIRRIIKQILDKEIRFAVRSLGINIPKSTFTTGKGAKVINEEDLKLLNEFFPKQE